MNGSIEETTEGRGRRLHYEMKRRVSDTKNDTPDLLKLYSSKMIGFPEKNEKFERNDFLLI